MENRKKIFYFLGSFEVPNLTTLGVPRCPPPKSWVAKDLIWELKYNPAATVNQ